MTLLDHTIVNAQDRDRSATFLILDLPTPTRVGPFSLVRIGATTTLDFTTVDGPVHPQHYAFLVTEAGFDAAFGRIRERALPYWADPQQTERGAINTWDGAGGRTSKTPAATSSRSSPGPMARVAPRRRIPFIAECRRGGPLIVRLCSGAEQPLARRR